MIAYQSPQTDHIAQKVTLLKYRQELAYLSAFKLVSQIDANLTRQTRHYRRDGRLLTTLDEVVRAILDNDLEVTR